MPDRESPSSRPSRGLFPFRRKGPRERIYLLPRISGLVFAFFVLLVFALGYVQPGARGLPQVLGIALVVAGIAVLIQSNENLRGVRILRCTSQPVPAGEPVRLEVTVHNAHPTERVGLTVREGWRWREKWRRRNVAPIPLLESGETRTILLPLTPGPRGRFSIPTLWVSSVLPVGLCFAWKAFPDLGTYDVYPVPRGRPWEGDSLDRGRDSGLHARSEGGDVSGHRPYEVGDPPSRLDWRVFARTGNLVVRTREEGGAHAATLRWADTGFLSDPEARLEQLSYWIAQCERENRPFRLDLGDGRTGLTEKDLPACRIALATFRVRP